MSITIENLTNLRIAGMLSEAARIEVERKIQEALTSESSETSEKLSFG